MNLEEQAQGAKTSICSHPTDPLTRGGRQRATIEIQDLGEITFCTAPITRVTPFREAENIRLPVSYVSPSSFTLRPQLLTGWPIKANGEGKYV